MRSQWNNVLRREVPLDPGAALEFYQCYPDVIWSDDHVVDDGMNEATKRIPVGTRFHRFIVAYTSR